MAAYRTRKQKRRLANSLLLGYAYIHCKKKYTKKRRFWVQEPNRQRKKEGGYVKVLNVYREKEHHENLYKGAIRMDAECFDRLLQLVKTDLTKKLTYLREPISPEQRLAITLSFLSTGDSIRILAMFYRIGISTARDIIYETCDVLWKRLQPFYLVTPNTDLQWKNVAKEFDTLWNYPCCIGAVDGKHCQIQAPSNTGSEYFNYKKTFSIVLMAICDATYKFIYIDVGTPGRFSDGGTFDQCSLNAEMNDNKLNIPADITLLDSALKVPYHFVGDEAFPLKEWLMRPFPGRSLDTEAKKVYNYRLSRARRTIENAFGIMVARWRCLRNSLCVSADNAQKIVLACCVLHNYMRVESLATYTPSGFCDSINPTGEINDGEWRQRDLGSVTPGVSTNARNSAMQATTVRSTMVDYFNGPGSVQWQLNHIRRTN